jgi:TIR domain
MAMARLSVFESYSRADESPAAQIAGDLGEIGLDVWRDQRLSGGQEWWDTILHSIRSADVFLFVVSDNSLDSVPCTRELEYADALGKRVLPVRIDRRTSPKVAPRVLASKEWVDYDADDRASVLRLMRAVNDLSPAGPLPVPLPTEPEVPLSYTTNLAALVHQVDELTPAEQHSLLFQLRDGLQSKADREECGVLLARLRTRRELLASVAAEIDRALEDLVKQKSATPPKTPITNQEHQGGADGWWEGRQTAGGVPPPGAVGAASQHDQPVQPGGASSGSTPSPSQPLVAPRTAGSVGRTLALVGGILGAIAAVVFAFVLMSGSSNSPNPGPDDPIPDNGPANPGPDDPAPPPDDSSISDLDDLAAGCDVGVMSDCDTLYWESESGSEHESFGGSCGERGVTLNGSCAADLPFPYIYGDDATLDDLTDACTEGDWVACDDLYFSSESGSAYEAWGATCGDRVDSVNGFCEEEFA